MIGKPAREDDVTAWLKRWRDRFPKFEECPEVDIAYDVIDGMLDDYRARADYGISLNGELPDWAK